MAVTAAATFARQGKWETIPAKKIVLSDNRNDSDAKERNKLWI